MWEEIFRENLPVLVSSEAVTISRSQHARIGTHTSVTQRYYAHVVVGRRDLCALSWYIRDAGNRFGSYAYIIILSFREKKKKKINKEKTRKTYTCKRSRAHTFYANVHFFLVRLVGDHATTAARVSRYSSPCVRATTFESDETGPYVVLTAIPSIRS